MVDVTATKKLQQEYQVRGVLTEIVYDRGVELFRITGFEPPARFL